MRSTTSGQRLISFYSSNQTDLFKQIEPLLDFRGEKLLFAGRENALTTVASAVEN